MNTGKIVMVNVEGPAGHQFPELTLEDKTTVFRAHKIQRFLSQPFCMKGSIEEVAQS